MLSIQWTALRGKGQPVENLTHKRLYMGGRCPYVAAFRRTRVPLAPQTIEERVLLTPAWVNNLQGVT